MTSVQSGSERPLELEEDLTTVRRHEGVKVARALSCLECVSVQNLQYQGTPM